MQTLRSYRIVFAVFAYLLVTGCGLYALFGNWAYDDPFITYRYARNLAHGIGFVYNPGEHILSTTTPLFTLLLAAFSYGWDDLPHMAVLLGCFSLGIGALFLCSLARSWQAPCAGWAVLVLYPTFPLLIATLGSEIPLYLAFCLGALVFYGRRALLPAACCAALATLTRPDGLLVAVVLGSHYVYFNKKLPWKAMAVFTALLLPWLVYSWVNFSSLIPATLAAKQQQALMKISQDFLTGFVSTLKPFAQRWPYWILTALALAGLYRVGYDLWTTWRRRADGAGGKLIQNHSPVLLLAWSVLYFCAYAALGVSRYFWYYAALAPAFLAMAGLGLHAAVQFLIPKNSVHPQKLALLASGLLVLPLAAYQLTGAMRIHCQPDTRYPVYRSMGEWIAENTAPDARIGALEVGILGYYAQRPMIDFAGLIQPEIARRLSSETDYEDAARWAVKEYSPDYLALGSGMFPELEKSLSSEKCHAVQQFPGWAGTQTWTIYACQP